MIEREVVIGHRLGIHARAAARLVQLSGQFQSSIVLFRFDNEPVEADARSILGILLLAATYGSKIGIRANGVDEVQAIESICEYLAG